MSERSVTDQLRAALQERADQVRTSPDALVTIRSRIHGRAQRRRSRLVIGFAALATATAAAGVAAVVNLPDSSMQRQLAPPVVASASVAPPPGTLPVYVLGEVAGRSVLYREFRPIRPEGT